VATLEVLDELLRVATLEETEELLRVATLEDTEEDEDFVPTDETEDEDFVAILDEEDEDLVSIEDEDFVAIDDEDTELDEELFKDSSMSAKIVRLSPGFRTRLSVTRTFWVESPVWDMIVRETLSMLAVTEYCLSQLGPVCRLKSTLT
tara:strand:+ start:574 stop:1017 length:444 start_codon:yes stop_codon:yes gene_type:complete